MIDRIVHILTWIFFTAAFIFSFISIWDRILLFFGWSLTWLPFSRWRLIEVAVIALIFVITLLLRQIREELRKQSAKS